LVFLRVSTLGARNELTRSVPS